MISSVQLRTDGDRGPRFRVPSQRSAVARSAIAGTTTFPAPLSTVEHDTTLTGGLHCGHSSSDCDRSAQRVSISDRRDHERKLARPEGLEPSTPGLEGRCSIQLSYGRVDCMLLERQSAGPTPVIELAGLRQFRYSLSLFDRDLAQRSRWCARNDRTGEPEQRSVREAPGFSRNQETVWRRE